MSVVNNNSRAEKVSFSPFPTQPPIQEQPQATQITQPPIQEQPKTTVETLNNVANLKKHFKNQTLTLSTRNLAMLKVIANLQKKSQGTCLDEILDNYYNNSNFDDEIKKMIESTEKMI